MFENVFKNNMKFQTSISNEIVAGVLIGGICLSGILYMLNSTEDEAISLLYSKQVTFEREQY
mgnify:CR=1 FL=1